MTELDSADALRLREQMVRTIGDRCDASHRVLQAMLRVPRHMFLPSQPALVDAYRDAPYPIGRAQTISQPTVVAMMTDALNLTGAESVLEIGTGSGYQTAILCELAAVVRSVELVAELAERSREVLARLGYRNLHLRHGDGYAGWPEAAPFDRIILTAAPPEIPPTLLDQLADGGLVVAPVGERFSQRLMRLSKQGRRIVEEYLGAVAFVPMVAAPRP